MLICGCLYIDVYMGLGFYDSWFIYDFDFLFCLYNVVDFEFGMHSI